MGEELDGDATLGGGIIILITLLIITMIIGHWLKQRKFMYLHEAGVATIIGILSTGFLELIGQNEKLSPVTNLNVDFFLLFLLPPIIFESGYTLDKKPFFKNFGGILLYAFSGTFVSAMVVGLAVWLSG
jgi:sodium/hydrogen exchanger 8